VNAVFRAVAATVVPEAERLGPEEWRELEAIVEGALADRPRALRRRLGLLLHLVEHLPLLRYGARFTRLGAAPRARVLAALQDAPLVLLRRGFWGLRTLVLMGYYGRPAAAREIGYRADRRGWEARGAR
jgi:hypothetical protein